MSDPLDPYKPPQSAVDAPMPAASGTVPPSVVGLLVQTRPWVKLASAMFLVCLALLLLVPMLLATRGGFNWSPATFLPFLVMTFLAVTPTVFLWQFAGGVRRLQDGGGLPALEEALARQKSFWKYVGIVMLVLAVIYSLAFTGIGLFDTPSPLRGGGNRG